MTAKFSALLLSGGGWHGAVQRPVIEDLLLREAAGGAPHNLIGGVSVGSINGACYAQGLCESVAWPLWDWRDDRHVEDGIKGFLAPAYLRGRALFKLDPARRLLEKHVDARKLRTAFFAGVVKRETREYRNCLFVPPAWSDTLTAPLRAAFGPTPLGIHDAIIASAAVAGVMEPVTTTTGTWCDGGHVHVLPRLPDAILPFVGAIDAVFCKPVHAWEVVETAAVDKLGEAMAWALECALDAARLADFAWLRSVAQKHPEIRIRVFAPPQVHGGMLDARRSDIEARYALGRAALEHPIMVGGAP